MPHGIEYIVRPFQAPGSLGNVVIPGTPARTQEQAHITWGGKGTLPETKILNPSTTLNTCHETAKEQSRDTNSQRIVGNDGESYVDVDRVKSMKLDKTETTISPSTLSRTQSTPTKLDPRIADDPGFHATTDVGPNDKRCGVVWSFAV